MIRWPAKAGQAIAKLFRSIQDFDIFVEDQDDEQFYLALFRKAAGDHSQIKRVVGLGGRDAVMTAALDYREPRKALFLIDGDLAFVLGEPMAPIPRLFRLECYCVENLVVRRSLVHEVCAEECACETAIAADRVQFDAWLSEVRGLVPVFARFAVLSRIDPAAQTVGGLFAAIVEADDKGLPRVSQAKVEALLAALDGSIDALLGREERERRIRTVLDRAATLEYETDIVSGKAALLPLLHFELKRASGSKITRESFRYRLALKAARNDLHQLVAALEVAA